VSGSGEKPALAQLQLFQERFDRACNFEPPEGNALEGLEFAALALAGEVGEVANLLKKARRAAWRGEPVALDRGELSRELADVLAYTLKLSNLLGVDLGAIYQEKMRVNWGRFSVQPRVLTIMGPPGVGKSTVVARLSSRFPSYLERTAENPHLHGTDWPTAESALNSQIWFMEETGAAVVEAERSQPLIIDQDPRAIVEIYGELMVQLGWLEEMELARLRALLRPIEDNLHRWSAGWQAILLDAEPDVLIHRVKGRDGSGAAAADHLSRLHAGFLRLASRTSEITTVKTDDLGIDEVVDVVEAKLCATA
jgi:NTP pyrophosphatase (non-canonical NTP hydrolase)/deoxyadenosine/deoxycytidine kinase